MYFQCIFLFPLGNIILALPEPSMHIQFIYYTHILPFCCPYKLFLHFRWEFRIIILWFWPRLCLWLWTCPLSRLPPLLDLIITIFTFGNRVEPIGRIQDFQQKFVVLFSYEKVRNNNLFLKTFLAILLKQKEIGCIRYSWVILAHILKVLENQMHPFITGFHKDDQLLVVIHFFINYSKEQVGLFMYAT